MYSLLLFWACQSMEPSGQVFAPVPATTAPAAPPAAPPDPEWTIPAAPPDPVIPSEKLQQPDAKTVDAAPPTKDLFGNPVTPPEKGPDPAPPAEKPPEAAPAVGLPSDPWPVRLLATLPQAQPPRAVLGLPSGEEKVVSPGSILADQGLVVMGVSSNRVQLAKISAGGDHATIQSLELTAQYPSP